MNALTAAIANHLKVEPSQVKEIRDFKCWNGGEVWLAVIQGKGARFVSKKAIKISKTLKDFAQENPEKEIMVLSLMKMNDDYPHWAGFCYCSTFNYVEWGYGFRLETPNHHEISGKHGFNMPCVTTEELKSSSDKRAWLRKYADQTMETKGTKYNLLPSRLIYVAEVKDGCFVQL